MHHHVRKGLYGLVGILAIGWMACFGYRFYNLESKAQAGFLLLSQAQVASPEPAVLAMQQAPAWFADESPSAEKTVNLKQANLQDANLEGIYLIWAEMEQANLQNANLRGAYLSWANLSKANLQNAHLEGANLQGANLQGADLRGAILTQANLQGANLLWTNLARADLKGTILTGTFLTWVNLNGAIYDDETLFPQGFVPQTAGLKRMTE